MKDCLQIGKNQHLEPKEILRQRNGAHPQTSEYLVEWNIVTQSSTSSNQSDSSSSSSGKEDKSILIWMTKEEVEVCCGNLLGSGLAGLVGQESKPLYSARDENDEVGVPITTDTEFEDFEDMRDDVQKLVTRARRQMKKSESGETKPIKNISYTLKVLSTYASLGSLATVFRQTGALDLILELLWSKDIETRRHAGRMLKALASHDGGSRAYVLLSLIQDKHGQMTRSDDADFENRNMVMEMFAETSSGEEAHTVSLDFMQLPQIPGKALFKLMKCYLKVTSLLDMDSQFGQLMTDGHNENNLKKEVEGSDSNTALFGDRKFEVTMAITDLIYELCEVMAWNNKSFREEATSDDDTITQHKETQTTPPTKVYNEKEKAVFSKYKEEFSQFMDTLISREKSKSSSTEQEYPGNFWTGIRKEMDEKDSMVSQMLGMTFRRGLLKDQTSGVEAGSPSSQLKAIVDELRKTTGEKETTPPLDKVTLPPSASSLLEPKKSHCIFASKHREGLDQKLLAELIKTDASSTKTSATFREPSSFSSVSDYEDYVRSMLRPGWYVKAIDNNNEVKKGDEGVFERITLETPSGNVAVYWFRLGSQFTVRENGVQILGKTRNAQANCSAKDLAKNLPEFLRAPENSKLWPVLIGQDVHRLSDHPYSSGLGSAYDKFLCRNKSTPQNILAERQWWEVLFFIQKLKSDTQLEAFSEIQKITGSTIPSGVEPSINSFKDVVLDIYQIKNLLQHLADVDGDAEVVIRNSRFCARFLKPRASKKKKWREIQKFDRDPVDKSQSSPTKENETTASEDRPSTSKGLANDLPDTLKALKPTDAASSSTKEETKSDQVHDYLIFISRQSSKFLDTLISHNILKTFLQVEDVKFEHVAEAANANAALDHLPDAKTRRKDRVIALIFLHHILKKQLKTPFSNHTLNSVLFKLQPIPQEDDLDICIAWMECIRIILYAAQHHGPSKMRGAEVIVATSGCLVGLMRILKWFPTCMESTMKAIKCLSAVMQAVKFHTSPGDGLRSPEAQIIRAVIDSIVSAAGSFSLDNQEEESELSAFFQSINFIVNAVDKLLADSGTRDAVRWTDNESNSEVGALYEAMCVCNFLITDQKELLKKSQESILPILKRILQFAPDSSPLYKISNALRSKVSDSSFIGPELSILDLRKQCSEDFSFTPEEAAKPAIVHEKLEIAMEELLDPENFSKLSNAMGRLLNFLSVILYDEQIPLCAPISRIVNTLFPAILFPNMNQKMTATELSQCVDIIEHVLFGASSSSAQSLVLLSILEEKHRPTAISSLLQLVETLSISTPRSSLDSTDSSLLKEIVTKAVSLLQRIADADRDSAVVMCGLDAKQSLAKAIEKHDSILKASELIEFLSGYDRYRSLHSKLLVVVLGGTIGVALRSMEDARRMQDTLRIPLLDRLFASLCQGSDFDVKEDKCWDKIEVSSNHRQSGKLTDGNSSTYWESNGSSGSHWINIYMRRGVVIRKLTVQISQDDSSYMPGRFVVMGMTRPSDMSHQLNVVTVSTTDTKIVVLENEKKYWPIIRICVRKCQQGGIDTRIRGIEIIGPKPSFWPVLRQQLCVRTCLAYFVRARAWIASCTKTNEGQPAPKRRKLMNHGILKLSSRIIDAIRHEQEFADLFLPNDEASMVLGQAFRSAVTNPLVTAVLDASINEENSVQDASLIFQLFSLYLEMSNPPAARSGSSLEMEQMEFLSRLRRLTRLLVDLNPTSACNFKRTHDSGIGKWRQPMQSKSSKDDDGSKADRSKNSSPPSVRSFMREAMTSDKTKEVEAICTDELLDPTLGPRSWSPGLTPLASQWCSVITTRLQAFLNNALEVKTNVQDMTALTKAGQEFCRILSKEYECIRSCTSELFGASMHFLTKLVKGIAMAVATLDINQTVLFSRNAAVTIHELLMKAKNLHMTQKDLEILNHIVEFLFLSNWLDWGCVFEPLYCALLASRLLNCEMPLIELEKQICNVLRACFPDGRPSLMLQDASHSKDLWKGFTSHRMEMFDTLAMWASSENFSSEQKQSLNGTLEENWKKYCLYKSGAVCIQVLSPVAWRLHATRKEAVPDLLERLNSDLLSILRDYEAFFQSAYRRAVSPSGSRSSGPLHWTGEGWAEVLDTVTGQSYKVTTTQMLLLLHFDSGDENEVDIFSWKYAFPHHWELALKSLTDANVLKQTAENHVVLNEEVKGKTPVYEVIDITSSRREEAEILNRMNDVEYLTDKRNTIIDCAIVQCIKKEPCQMDTLIFNVIKHCLGEPREQSFFSKLDSDSERLYDSSNRNNFFPLSSEVIARCELLFDLGYIKRDPENPQMVQYVPEVAPIRSRATTVTAENDLSQLELEESKIQPELKKDKVEEPKATEHKTTELDIAREITATDENIEEEEENDDNWKTAESSSTISSCSSTGKKNTPKSGAIPKVSPKKITETKDLSDSLFPYSELVSWHLVHGMSENPAVITLRKSCQSLSKNEVFSTMWENVGKLSKVLSCDNSIIEALLLEMDWRVNDLIDHYTTNKTTTLCAIGITEKCGQPKEFQDDLSEMGAASPSTSHASSSENCCPVCTNELELSECPMLECGHQCCHNCWRTYLTQKLDENQAANTKCTVSGCESRPTLKTYKILFKNDEDKLERYKTALVRSYVESNRSLSWCHCPVGCEMIVKKGTSFQNIGTCANCGWETCFSCTYSEAHYPASCGHMSEWLEDGGYYDGMGEDARSKHFARLIAKRCPKCQANIEKEDGCLHMKCLKCSHDFCWRCLKDWRPTHRDYYKCSAKVSKLAQAGMKFQEHNKKCRFHHKAKAFPLEILRRLMTVNATTISTINLIHAIRACAVLMKARKTLAYCNIFSYYSADTEKMETMELHSQVLENNALHLQEFLDKILLGVADITHCVANMKESERIALEEFNSKIGDQLKSVLLFSAQDMKVGMPAGKLKPVEKNHGPRVITHARPAGMSDDDEERCDPFGIFSGGGSLWEEAAGHSEAIALAWVDDEDNDERNFPSSEDTFSHDDDDDDDDEDDDSDDTDMVMDGSPASSDFDIFDTF